MTASVPTDVQRRRRTFVMFWAATVIVVLCVFREVLVPFVMAALLAYVFTPVVRGIERVALGRRSVPRWLAVVAFYAVIVGSVFGAARTAVPIVIAQAGEFVRNEIPRIREEAGARWLPKLRRVGQSLVAAPTTPTDVPSLEEERSVVVAPREHGGYEVRLPRQGIQIEPRGSGFRVIPERGLGEPRHDEIDTMLDRARLLSAGHTDDLVRMGRGILGGIVSGVFGFFITLMLSAYLVMTRERVLTFIESLVDPAWRGSFQRLLARVDQGLSGVVRGQLVICAVNGALSAVGFFLAHLPYWPLLALLAAMFSIIPIFGSILSSVPAVLLGLRTGVGTGVFVLAWILGIHQLEANLLNPKIMGDAAKIHPVLVVFSLLAGEHFFGILGALLAVPTLSIVQSVFLHWRAYALDYPAQEAADG